MNKLKKTLALVAALTLVSTAFVGCDKDDDSSSSKAATTTVGDSSSEGESKVDSGSELNLATGGDKFTILAWNANDIPAMLDAWKGSTDVINTDSSINFVNFEVGGGAAADKYDQYFLTGDDIDMFAVEADWALKYIDSATLTAPLSDVGFSESDFSNAYGYTLEIGKDSSGVLKGVSWQAAPGGFAYRSDLAEQYLGVKTPEEMQAKVSDWDKFMATAKEVSDASGKKTALTTTLGGVWQVFSANRSDPWVVDNKLVVDESCKEFIQMAKDMRDNGYVTDLAQWADEWKAVGQTDTTMGYFVSTWGFGDTILEGAAGGPTGKTYGKWAVCVGPAEFFWGGTWLVVSPKTDNAQECHDFIKAMTIDEASMKAYALSKPEYVNNKAVMQAIVDEKSNSNENLGGQDQFAVLHEVAKGIDLSGAITPYDATIKTAFIDAVNEYCEGKLDSVDATVDYFKDKVAGAIGTIEVE